MKLRFIEAVNAILMLIAIILLAALLLFLTTHEVQIVPSATPTNDRATFKVNEPESVTRHCESLLRHECVFCIRDDECAEGVQSIQKRQSSIVVFGLAPSRRTTRTLSHCP
jgi:hypothetical protein